MTNKAAPPEIAEIRKIAALVERYARRSGRDVSNVRYYQIFALFKVAVVVQQIYYRWVKGQTTDSRFATLDARVAALATRAARLASL